jgi:TetR/AcrR family transcriptional regulator, transcriptional repressor for nem operon
MARPREFDEQRALTAAMEVFWEKGYEAASLSDLTSRMGIQRPSLYAAFGDKRALFDAALNRYTEMSYAFLDGMFERAASAREAVQGYFAWMMDTAYTDGPYLGCLCVNTMVELAPHDDRLAAYTQQYQLRLAELFRRTIQHGMDRGELSSRMDAEALANTLLIAAVGLNVALKSKPDRKNMEQAVKNIVGLLS